jgi:hypothetical protein
MAIEKIDKLKKIDKKVKLEIPAQEPNKEHFEALMRQRQVKTEEVQGIQGIEKELAKKTESTIFDEVKELGQRVDFASKSTPHELASQAEGVIAEIDVLKNKLETPNLEIKSSVQTLLRNKLSHIDENLKVALDNAGLEYKPPEKANSLAKPIDRFLGLLTHSQSQLETLAEDVKTMSLMEKELSPASMLMIQIKVSYIQQEIELFTSMLNKALESTKTIMNVQV